MGERINKRLEIFSVRKVYDYELVVPITIKQVKEQIVKLKFSAMSSAQRRSLVDIRESKNPEKLITRILSENIQGTGTEDLSSDAVATKLAQALTYIDRELLLFKIRAITFGKMLPISRLCIEDACKNREDEEIDLQSIALKTGSDNVEYTDEGVPFLTLNIDDVIIKMRLTNGEDGEICVPLGRSNPVAAQDRIKQRCCISIDDIESPTLDQMDEILTPKMYDDMHRLYSEKSPTSDFEGKGECASCGEATLLRMSIIELLFSKSG